MRLSWKPHPNGWQQWHVSEDWHTCAALRPRCSLLHSADSAHSPTDWEGRGRIFLKQLFSWFPPWQLNGKNSLIDCSEIQALTGWHELSPTDKLFLPVWNENLPDRYQLWMRTFLCKTFQCFQKPFKETRSLKKQQKNTTIRHNWIASVIQVGLVWLAIKSVRHMKKREKRGSSFHLSRSPELFCKKMNNKKLQ